jgi:hypothetical protein
MPARPTPSKFLAFHTIVAFAIASGMFALFCSGWMRALPFHRPQQPSFSQLLLISVPVAAFAGGVYWFLAWRVSRSLEHLVALKPQLPLPTWQRDSMRRVTSRVLLLGLGMLFLMSALAIVFHYLSPDAGSGSIIFLMLFIMLPPAIVSFAYRQGVHDAEHRDTTPPSNEA